MYGGRFHRDVCPGRAWGAVLVRRFSHENPLRTGCSRFMEDDFERGGPGSGYLLRLIRSLKVCCPRPASWSTNLQRYNTFRQSGFARPSESRSRVPRNRRRRYPLPGPHRIPVIPRLRGNSERTECSSATTDGNPQRSGTGACCGLIPPRVPPLGVRDKATAGPLGRG